MGSAARAVLERPDRGAHLAQSERRLDEALTSGLLNQIAEAERLGRPCVDESASEQERRLAARDRCLAAVASYRTLLLRRGAWVR